MKKVTEKILKMLIYISSIFIFSAIGSILYSQIEKLSILGIILSVSILILLISAAVLIFSFE